MKGQLGKVDTFLLLLVTIAAVCGIINLYGQEYSSAEVYGSIFDYKWVKQSIRLLIAFIALFLMVILHYQLIGSYAHAIYLFSIVLLLLTLMFGDKVNGARSWLSIAGFRVGQPAEFAKLTTIILLGKYLVLKEKDISKFSELIIPFGILLVPMLLILKQPDFGTALSFVPIFFTILFIGGADILQIGSLVFFGFFSMTIPMYVAYHKLSLLQPLMDYLNNQGASKLAYGVKVLGKKVWDMSSSGVINPDVIAKYKLEKVFAKEESFDVLKNATLLIKREQGGLLLQFFENYNAIFVFAAIMIFITLILWAMKFTAGINHRRIMIPLGVIGITLITAVILIKTVSFSNYQVNRLTAFINPEKFKDRAGYQLRASKIATGSGALFGNGLTYDGMTSGVLPLVPEASTDFSFASWSERFGFIGSIFLLVVLMAIPLRGLQVAFESKDRLGAIFASGVTTMIFYHLFINIGIVLGLLPVTGLPLSFFSFGGSNLIVSFMGIGLLINIKLRKHAN